MSNGQAFIHTAQLGGILVDNSKALFAFRRREEAEVVKSLLQESGFQGKAETSLATNSQALYQSFIQFL